MYYSSEGEQVNDSSWKRENLRIIDGADSTKEAPFCFESLRRGLYCFQCPGCVLCRSR